MLKRKNIWLIAFFSFALYSCSCGDGRGIGPTLLIQMAQKKNPDVQRVPIPKEETRRRVLCSSYEPYGDGCVPGFGMRLKVYSVELVAVRFENTQKAAAMAERLDQWYFRNWLLDDVKGEPVLEEFVQKAFNARPGRPPRKTP